MNGVLRWRLSLTARSLRWVPPLLFQVAAIAILCASGNQPLDSTLTETAIATLFAGAWFGVTHTDVERPSHTEMVDVAVGPERRVLATAVAALPFLLAAATVAVVGPLAVSRRGEQALATTLTLALAAQWAVALSGYAVGAAAHRVGRGNRAWIVLFVILVNTLILAAPSAGLTVVSVGLPPVIDAAKSVEGGATPAYVSWCAIWSVVLLAAIGASYRLRTVSLGRSATA